MFGSLLQMTTMVIMVPYNNSEGEQIDILNQGIVSFHHISHFVNGVEVWGKCQGFGEAISVNI
jgi:hypothetical protein